MLARFPEQFLEDFEFEEVRPSIPWEIASWEMLSGFVLPVLENCSAVWCSAADIYTPETTGPCCQYSARF